MCIYVTITFYNIKFKTSPVYIISISLCLHVISKYLCIKDKKLIFKNNINIYRDIEPVVRNENFRLFACMNPATDVGKKDLPIGIRNRYLFIYSIK